MDRYRKAVFAVAYSKNKNEILYVILKRKKHWKGWEFPKGKIEKGEKKSETALREVREETGLKCLGFKTFKVEGDYKYDKELSDRPGIVGQTFSLFAVELEKGKIKVDSLEHTSGKFVSFNEALEKLTWPNQRRCLRIVNKSLTGKNKKD